MRNRITWLTITGACWLLLTAAAVAQDEPAEVPDSIDTVYVESIDPYAVVPGHLLAFDYEEYATQARAAYQAGDYEQAARYYIALIRRNIDDHGALYDLACCYGLLDYGPLAGFMLEAAFAAGFEDYDWASWDPDFESVREDPMFLEAWERIGELIEEQQEGLGEEIVVAAPVFMKCRVHLPANYDPAESYPLIVGLHGYGSNPDRFGQLFDLREIDSSGFIYAAPQAPYPYLPGKRIGYSWIGGEEESEDSWMTARAMSEDYIVAAVSELESRYPVSDVYLMGFSQGCVMTYNAGLTYPERFSGLIGFAGWLERDHFTDEQLAAASHLPVFIGQGLTDTLVEPQASYEARNVMEAFGFTVELYEFEGGHTVDGDALRAALEWLGL